MAPPFNLKKVKNVRVSSELDHIVSCKILQVMLEATRWAGGTMRFMLKYHHPDKFQVLYYYSTHYQRW